MSQPNDLTTSEITVQTDGSNAPEFWRRFFVFDVQIAGNLRRLWESRYLAWALTVRGIRARYKQSLLGVGWALLTPLAMTLVFTYLYGALNLTQKVFPCPRTVYLLFTLAFWSFFSKAVTNGSTSLVQNMDLVTKVYFPREVLPVSSVFMNLIDLALAFLMWTVVAAGWSFLFPGLASEFPDTYPYYPNLYWLWLPTILFFHILLILGISFVTSALQVYFRDIGHIVSLMLFLWLVITPVLIPLRTLAGGRYTMLININPMTGIIDGYRLAAISRQNPFYAYGLWEHHVVGAALFSVILFLVGYCFFKHEERYFADVV